MKKLLSISLALLLIAALMVPAFAADAPLLADDADLLSSEEESIILKKLTQTSDALDMDIVIVTTADVAGKSLRDYADDYYDDNGFGVGMHLRVLSHRARRQYYNELLQWLRVYLFPRASQGPDNS